MPRLGRIALVSLLGVLGCSAASGGKSGDGGPDVGLGSNATAGSSSTGSEPGLQLPGASDAGSNGSSPDACIELKVEFERLTPTVMLLIDQSHTMVIPFEEGPGGRSRWNTVRDILTDPTSGLIPKLQDSVRFGLALYSAKSPVVCPALTEVSIALDNYQAIRDVYATQEVLDHTPTSESLTAVAGELAKYPEPGPKVIV